MNILTWWKEKSKKKIDQKFSLKKYKDFDTSFVQFGDTKFYTNFRSWDLNSRPLGLLNFT